MLPPRFVSWFRHLCRPATTGKAFLTLEELEDRLTPSVAPNALYVSTLYQGLLGRNADANGLNYWVGQLNTGVTRTQVAQEIGSSPEALNYDVNQFYDTLLNRPADHGGLSYWTGELQAGESLDQVKAGILGSNEFLADAGNTNASFLDSLYTHELGRQVDAAGLGYWETQLANGATREQVADNVLASPEGVNEKVTSFYEDVLGRTPDTAGLNYWSAQLESGVPETQVLAGLFGSNEFYGKVQNLAATTATTDPNQAASNLIAAQNLLAGPLPNAEYLVKPVGQGTVPVVVPPVFVPVPPDVPASTGEVIQSGTNNRNTQPPTGTGTDTSTDNTAAENAATYNTTDTSTTTDDTYDDTTTDCGCGDTGATDDGSYVDTGSTDDTSYADPGSTDDGGSVDTSGGDDFSDPTAGGDF